MVTLKIYRKELKVLHKLISDKIEKEEMFESYEEEYLLRAIKNKLKNKI